MALHIRYNNEDILVRAVIAGLLNILNNEIKYEQVWSSDDIETIKVPWFYNMSGDQRFMQDFYTHYGHCLPPRPADGNFDMIPRGVITYKGSPIDEQRITTRYIQGRYIKEVDGQLNSYISYLYSLPLSIPFEAEMWIDKEISALKIEQEIREVFYKTKTFYVYYKGMRVGCTVGFPAELRMDKNINYSHEPENRIKLNFNLEVETYQPVFDPTREMLADYKIKGFGYRLYEKGEKTDGEIKDLSISSEEIDIITPSENIIIPKGIPLWIEWIYAKEGAIISNVNIYWSDNESDDLKEIELYQANREFYIWNIPTNFTNYKHPILIWEERKLPNPISVSRSPLLKVVPDLETKEITEESFKAFSEGYFYTAKDDASINIQLEMKDDNGNISYSEEGDIWANIKFNKLDLNNPVSFAPDVSLYFPGTIDYKVIDVHVLNSVNRDVAGILSNIKIV